MRRALVWLNLYGCEAVRQKFKNSLKTQKMHFLLFLSLCLTASRPYRLSHTNASLDEEEPKFKKSKNVYKKFQNTALLSVDVQNMR